MEPNDAVTGSQKILIFCDGGFGNRLNTLLSGLAIARQFDLQATIHWPTNNWCQAAFDDIFSNPWKVSEQSLSQLAGTLDDTVALLHDQLGADTLHIPFQSAYAYDSMEDFSSRVIAGGRRIFYYPALIPQWLPNELIAEAVSDVQFQKVITAAVAHFVQQVIVKPFHGLHLRRTDLNVGYSDGEVQELVRQYPQEAFFVCSDDAIAEALASVQPHVHRREKFAYVGKRDDAGQWNTLTADDDGRQYHSNIKRDKQSVIDAVIDLLILAHSSIVGYNGSTFQNMARLIGEHAPIANISKPALNIPFFAMDVALRRISAGTLTLGDCITQSTSLYAAGRKADAIKLLMAAIEHGRQQGIEDVNLFVLHYNLAANLFNEGQPYQAALYLEKALEFFPDHTETKNLLTLCRERCRLAPPRTASTQNFTVRGNSSATHRLCTFMRWHLGDNLIHLHFLRKLSEKYPEIEFHHALKSDYLVQCRELVEDNSRITLSALSESEAPVGLDAWKGADGFFFNHPNKFQFGALYLDLFDQLSRQLGLSTPFSRTADLLFDYPAIKTRTLPSSYDVLLVNSAPLSNQLKTYNELDFVKVAQTLRASGLRVITTKKIEGFDCSFDKGYSVTDVAALSLQARYFIAVCTGVMWPCINVFNQETHQFKIILNDHETVDIGRNIVMCRDSATLHQMVVDRIN